MKLVTGVDISTRPVRRFGKDGKAVNNSNRTAAAAPKRRAFCLSTAIMSGYPRRMSMNAEMGVARG